MITTMSKLKIFPHPAGFTSQVSNGHLKSISTLAKAHDPPTHHLPHRGNHRELLSIMQRNPRSVNVSLQDVGVKY